LSIHHAIDRSGEILCTARKAWLLDHPAPAAALRFLGIDLKPRLSAKGIDPMAHAKTVSETNYRTLIALLEKESRDLARDRAMVLLSMKAGLRADEISGIIWGCIREDDTIIELVKTKGGKPRTVPVPNLLLEIRIVVHRLFVHANLDGTKRRRSVSGALTCSTSTASGSRQCRSPSERRSSTIS
jgi:integrase